MLECIIPLCFRTLIPDSTLCLAYVYEGIFTLRMYIAIAFPYPMGRGVIAWYQSLG